MCVCVCVCVCVCTCNICTCNICKVIYVHDLLKIFENTVSNIGFIF